MEPWRGRVSRRDALKWLGAAAGGAAFGGWFDASSSAALAQERADAKAIEPFTGPGPNPHWNSIGPYISEPEKAPLILLTDRPVQLETPRSYFRTAFTPNDAFYVRWHLPEIPKRVDLVDWKLKIEGNVNKPLALSLSELMEKFKPVSVAAVNQCSGNSRSRFQPRVPGGQWGNGAMGNAMWTGVRLRELLDATGVKAGSVEVQFQGLETGPGPKGLGSNVFLKSLKLTDSVLDEAVVAYLMNGEPLPMLNGFPVRIVVPGYFATYWMKCLTWIRVLSAPDENFWMKTGYRMPDKPRGNTTPEEVKAGGVKTVPITRMPVRSFLVSPDGSLKIPAGMNVTLRGIAFSGYGRVVKVETSEDGAKTWREAELGEDLGAYSFRTWEAKWMPKTPGNYTVEVRATDEKGNVQTDEGVWNPGGYLWNKIEKQDIVVGKAS
ncbi:MAG: twin-arginine translocation pathway signal protein [Acidobacteria bacterium]|nr:MAG: twin-arginine translocation pathway signal protein [Acidobacteriota bacterium]